MGKMIKRLGQALCLPSEIEEMNAKNTMRKVHREHYEYCDIDSFQPEFPGLDDVLAKAEMMAQSRLLSRAFAGFVEPPETSER